MNALNWSPTPIPAPDLTARPLRFAVVMSAAVAVVAWFLASVAQVSEETIVISIMVVAFLASWIATGNRTVPDSNHQVTVIRVRSRI